MNKLKLLIVFGIVLMSLGPATARATIIHPSIVFSKTADTAWSKAGDVVHYTLTLHNTSSSDTPPLVCDIADPNLGVNKRITLASGGDDVTNVAYTVQGGDPDLLINNAVVACSSPLGDTVTTVATWVVDLLHPSFIVSKACKTGTEPIPAAGPAVFTITFNNTGDADLHVAPSEGAAFDVAAGETYSYDYSIGGPFSATVNNTVTGDVTPYRLPNRYTFSASGSCTVATGPEHFQAYDVDKPQSTRLPAKPVVDLVDPLIGSQNDVKVEDRPDFLFTPADKNGEGLDNPDDHLACYKIPGLKANRKVGITNQFGEQNLALKDGKLLCVPSAKALKDPAPSPPADPGVEHFQCYEVDKAQSTKLPAKPRVSLVDQFGSLTGVAVADKPDFLCNPVDKDGEGIDDDVHHLACYDIHGFRANQKVLIANQFGGQTLKLKDGKLLCVPSTRVP